MDTVAITQRLHALRDRLGWQPLHNPKNLAMAASVEMAELLECFQWLSDSQARQLDSQALEACGDEIADVTLYLLLLCAELGLDLPSLLERKMRINESRYPEHAP
ncbi:MazG-like family protein [Atopomonas sediminilitoris]|uniref:MazG-like family protein n=1 Tax=Atopomonas sediminilitoris TaxID=2919919 RepID=UPI001F4D8A09|nr:MazG-like family protein [Atopomonas sediminilitoris]MCJ8170627.1 nucleotide pyrophosphohydrolase [Atopomonas sediminilitoris]